jgi:predicted ester cyclase
MLSNEYAKDIKELSDKVENAELNNIVEVEEFFRAYMKLIWDYKMIGMIYNYYDDNVVIHCENGKELVGVEAFVKDTSALLAAFPDAKLIIEDVIVVGNVDDGYQLFSRRYVDGTNLGASKYGPPTGKKLGKVCLNLSMIIIKKIDNKWKIIDERCMHSARWIRKACTMDN